MDLPKPPEPRVPAVPGGPPVYFAIDQLQAYGEARANAERERCAQVCEGQAWTDNDPKGFLETVARRIRGVLHIMKS